MQCNSKLKAVFAPAQVWRQVLHRPDYSERCHIVSSWLKSYPCCQNARGASWRAFPGETALCPAELFFRARRDVGRSAESSCASSRNTFYTSRSHGNRILCHISCNRSPQKGFASSSRSRAALGRESRRRFAWVKTTAAAIRSLPAQRKTSFRDLGVFGEPNPCYVEFCSCLFPADGISQNSC